MITCKVGCTLVTSAYIVHISARDSSLSELATQSQATLYLYPLDGIMLR